MVMNRPGICSTTLLLGFLVSNLQSAEASKPASFVQDRIAIGFWSDPPADDKMEEHYKDIADANFTFVLSCFGATTPDAVQRELKLCEKFDLKAVVSMAGLPADKLPDSTNCWGYFVADEPGPGAFPSLSNTLASIAIARPGKFGYVNLLPDYAPAWALGSSNYADHVSRFIKETHPAVISMDFYPTFKPSGEDRAGYCRCLEVMRTQSVAAGIPFWNFFNTMPFGAHSDPTEAQLRWQMFTSLAYGAKGLMYFCYWTPAGDEFPKGGAIIQRDGTKTRHYEEAKRINHVIKNLGPTLMLLTSTGVQRVTPGENGTKTLTNAPIKTITDGDYLVGSFKHKDGRRALMLNNYHFAFSSWPTVEFDVPAEKVVEVNPETCKEAPVKDDSPAMKGLQISLDAGQGRLFLLPP
jgi:hypothetical protein